MLKYNAYLKHRARQLRKHLTDSESALWSRLRTKQLLGIQFYRQKPIGEHSGDFFALRASLVVAVDGAQHLAGAQALKDRRRDGYLTSLGRKVWRCNTREVLEESDAVAETIYRSVAEQLNLKKALNRFPRCRGSDENCFGGGRNSLGPRVLALDKSVPQGYSFVTWPNAP